MKIVITGASGFIGRRLCKYLHIRGYEIVGVVRNEEKAQYLRNNNIKYLFGDITDFNSMNKSFRDAQIVIHLAALFNNPELTWDDYNLTNVEGTENVLKASLENNVQRVIHCSTVGVATEINGNISSENTPYSNINWDKYESTKQRSEKLALEFHKKEKLPVVVIRPAQVYGPGDESKVKLYKMIKKGIIVNPGNTKKHLIYIDDLCKGFELALTNKNIIGDIIIIGNDNPIYLHKYIKLIAKELKVANPKFKIPVKPVLWISHLVENIWNLVKLKPPIFRRSMDFFIKSVHFDVSKAKSKLNFTSNVDIESGIAKTTKWYKEKGYIYSIITIIFDNNILELTGILV